MESLGAAWHVFVKSSNIDYSRGMERTGSIQRSSSYALRISTGTPDDVPAQMLPFILFWPLLSNKNRSWAFAGVLKVAIDSHAS